MEPQPQGTISTKESEVLRSEIDLAFAWSTKAVRDIMSIGATGMDGSLLVSYNNFYREFCLLVLLTKSLTNMKDRSELVGKAMGWLMETPNIDRDVALRARAETGINLYLTYTTALADLGIISIDR
jgi:hypothetical protein